MSRTVVIGTWCGIGDNIQMTPAVTKYKQLYPHVNIHILIMKRFEHCKDLWQGLADECYPILSDAWAYGDYGRGQKTVTKEIHEFANSVNADECYCLNATTPCDRDTYKFNKIFRFADELGVDLNTREECMTSVPMNKHWDPNFPYVVFHAMPGNKRKIPNRQQIKRMSRYFKGLKVVEIGSRFIEGSTYIDPMQKAANIVEIIYGAKLVVGVDSAVMHMAGALGKSLVAFFNVTPVHQAIPFWSKGKVIPMGFDNPETQLSNYQKYQEDFNNDFPE